MKTFGRTLDISPWPAILRKATVVADVGFVDPILSERLLRLPLRCASYLLWMLLVMEFLPGDFIG